MYLVGDNSKTSVQELINRFNEPKNKNGEYVKVIFGSSITKESFSFNFIQQTHVLTPHWNFSKISQVISRGLRFGSHKLLKDPRFEVYLHVSISSDRDYKSLDFYMYEVAQDKDISIKNVEHQIKKNAIDCEIFIDRNRLESKFNNLRECD